MFSFKASNFSKFPTLFSLVVFLVSLSLNPMAGPKPGQNDRLFPPHLLHASWQQFSARGYAREDKRIWHLQLFFPGADDSLDELHV